MIFCRKTFWDAWLLHLVFLFLCILFMAGLFLFASINKKPPPVRRDAKLQAGYDRAREKRRAAFNLRVIADYEKALADPKCADLVEHGRADIIERIVGKKFGLTGEEVSKIRSRLKDKTKRERR